MNWSIYVREVTNGFIVAVQHSGEAEPREYAALTRSAAVSAVESAVYSREETETDAVLRAQKSEVTA